MFPLPANTEQARVMELLRTETGVVVQGPPGTGKTHTIANLVSALLARRQRVLVTSQKDQALRVLRTKIPQELRNLCVLLVGGSKDAAVELEKGLDALSAAVAANNEADLTAQAQALRAERNLLRSKGVVLNEHIRGLREAELREHDPVVPGYRTDLYRGTLAAIVRDVLQTVRDHAWMPAVPDSASDGPPLPDRDIAELRQLLSRPDPARRYRLQQQIPTTQQLPTAAAFADLVLCERDAQRTAEQTTNDLALQLADLATDQLDQLNIQRQRIKQELHACGLGQSPPRPGREWVEHALEDHFVGKNAGLWGHVRQVRDEAARLQQRLREQGVEFTIDLPPITTDNLGPAHGWLNVGRPLLDYLAAGGKLRSRMPRRPQKEAQPLLDAVRVDGSPPKSAAQLRAALDRIEAEVAAVQLAQLWADAGVTVVAVTLPARLSELADNATLLDAVGRIGQLHEEVSTTLLQAGILTNLSDVRSFLAVLEIVPAALRHVDAARVSEQVSELHEAVRAWAVRPGACPELAGLVAAVVNRDIEQYTDAMLRIDAARVEQEAEHRRARLSQTLGDLHPELLNLLARTADDPAWEKRDVSAAWAWSKAHQFVQKYRSAEQDRQLTAEFAANEDRLRYVTGRLVANEATRACVSRMTDEQVMALRTYRALVRKTGKKSREFRRAASAAMVKAQDAVPAWAWGIHPDLYDHGFRGVGTVKGAPDLR
ncbi:MAG: AAA domain-containing protein [Pseudonocardiaceae bacterium]